MTKRAFTKSFSCFMMAILITLTPLLCSIGVCASAEMVALIDEQQNAAAMLNYITVLTQSINESKNSRLYMEEAYSDLINNTYPNAVDGRTLSQLTGLLDTMESYRMISMKRDRLQFIYEQNQAQAIRAAIPNPLGILSAVKSYRPSKLIASIAYMAIDSVTSYMAYTAETDLQYIKDGWALDDEEATVLHNSRKGIFSYMIKMVDEYDLLGDFTLTESAVNELVAWKNNDNVVSRIHFFESNQNIYQCYGGYWLMLAESYYANNDYDKCLDALCSYEALGTRIFRRDYEYAKVLPLAIAAADEIYSDEKYVAVSAEYARKILDNSDHKDWALRYFAAQVYVDLYGKTHDSTHLQTAYDIVLDNVNYLVGEQRTINAAYVAPVPETSVPKDATKEEKAQINNYNAMLKDMRKTELAPVYEPLLLNCELLFALADQLGVSESERLKIDGILHPKGEAIFLSKPLDDKYWFLRDTSETSEEISVEFGGTALVLPAEFLSTDTIITVSIKEANAEEAVTLSDWVLEKVERGTEGNVSTYQVLYTSAAAREHIWEPESEIIIDVVPKEGFALGTYTFVYTTSGTKTEWFDYLKVWEGQKNNWYDYLKVWENSVVFERVR